MPFISSFISRVKSPIIKLSTSSTPSSSVRASSPQNTSGAGDSGDDGCEATQKRKKETKRRLMLESIERERRFREEHERNSARYRYGEIPHGGYEIHDDISRENFANIPQDVGQTVLFRARIHNIRPMSAKLAFIIFRQQFLTVQGVLRATIDDDASPSIDEEGVSEHMVRWAEKLPRESIVLVEGRVREAQQEVVSTEVHQFEVDVLKLHLLSAVTNSSPWTVADAARAVDPDDEDVLANTGRVAGISLQSRLAHRAMDLRTPTNLAIFHLQSHLLKYARQYLDQHAFIEVHTAKLQPAATESGGASVFKVDYFGRAGFLAQSPQLGKEMCVAGDLERVYEVGPVFRAENSNTHRHMTEFTGLDVEMVIERTYTEALALIDGLLKHIFCSLQTHHKDLIDIVKRQFPHEDLVWLEETVVLPFREGVRMLKEDGWREDNGEGEEEIDEYDDLSRRAEVRLGELVKEKYNTDYYILDKFPLDVRPFYTMPDPDDPKLSNSFDIFVRGEEILSGGQRLHSAEELEKRLKEAGIDEEGMEDYVNAFRWGMPPHAGGGIGLERLVMLFLKLGNLRYASISPRDPKSFPNAPSASGKNILNTVILPHVDYVVGFDEPTVKSQDDMKKDEHPLLEDLIAQYGDSTNTAWTDPGYKVWRHGRTGAAIGYIDSHGHSISWGYPLCAYEDLAEVIRAYLDWLRHHHLKPIWLNVDARTEKILSEEMGWRALSVTADQRLSPTDPITRANKHVQRKIRAAERAGMTVKIVQGEVPAELRQHIDERVNDWKDSREGTQIHTTQVRPWADCQHRSYFIGWDKDGKACGLVSLAKLAPAHGYQIKWALTFPGSPQGTSEYLISHVIEEMRNAGVTTATFGAGAKDTVEVIDNIKGIKAKLLSEVYRAIVSLFSLTNKSQYREKFGVYEDPLYICYPEGSLGIQGIEAIMRSVKDPESKSKKKRRLRSNDSKATGSDATSDGTDASVRTDEDSIARKLDEIDASKVAR